MRTKQSERRVWQAQNLEAREEAGVLHLVGYAAKFNSPSRPLPFVETIMPGAFRKTLSEGADVRFMKDHGGTPMARTKNGTLILTEDEIGLRFDATLSDTTESRDMYTTVSRGDMDGMSFTFRAVRQSWSKNRDQRSLTEVSLNDCDISPVTYPAYHDTLVEARDVMTALESFGGAAVTVEDQAALQAAFEMARTGLGQLVILETGGLIAGEDEQTSLSFLSDAMNSLLAWRSSENWESTEPLPSLVVEANSSVGAMSLRFARALASRL